MTFKLRQTKDKFIDDVLEQAYPEYDDFFGIAVRPNVFIIPDRKSIDALRYKKTPDWLVGWSNATGIYLLDRKKYEQESCHKYNAGEYKALVKHELVHYYTRNYVQHANKSVTWLWEGLAIYLSGQLEFKKRPAKFDLSFLKKEDQLLIYRQAGFFVEQLINEHGKSKILGLIDAVRLGTFKERLKELSPK